MLFAERWSTLVPLTTNLSNHMNLQSDTKFDVWLISSQVSYSPPLRYLLFGNFLLQTIFLLFHLLFIRRLSFITEIQILTIHSLKMPVRFLSFLLMFSLSLMRGFCDSVVFSAIISYALSDRLDWDFVSHISFHPKFLWARQPWDLKTSITCQILRSF